MLPLGNLSARGNLVQHGMYVVQPQILSAQQQRAQVQQQRMAMKQQRIHQRAQRMGLMRGQDLSEDDDDDEVDDEVKKVSILDRIPFASGAGGSGVQDGEGETIEILRVDQKYDPMHGDFRLSHPPKTDTAAIAEGKLWKKRKPVLVIRRVYDHQGFHQNTVVNIESWPLRNLLIEINTGVVGLNLKKSTPEADPKLFFHSHAALEKALEKHIENGNADLIRDISVALEFVKDHFADTLADLKSMHSYGEISFNVLWTMFPPNTLAYTRNLTADEDRVVRVRNTEISYKQDGSRYLAIDCEYAAFDGSGFGIAQEELEIPDYSGSRPITTLPVYPLSFYADGEELRSKLIARGTKYIRLLKPTYKDYLGTAMKVGDRFERNIGGKCNASGRFMVDPAAFRKFKPDSLYLDKIGTPIVLEGITIDDLLICSPTLIGYHFGNKAWCSFSVSRIQDIVWKPEAFESLSINAEEKSLIYSLVKSHDSELTSFDDLIEGKGKGLIGLLSGPPGVGKTLSAEAVAEVTKRPLFYLSAGDLGTTSEQLDKQLSAILDLCQIWGAVLLLDEADVFLQARQNSDIERNALVSIFLRQLEYYQGILILTTNRLDSFDPAFQSRIHFSISYPELSVEARRAIWKTFIARAGVNAEISFSAEDLENLAKKNLNGRQIKNAIKTALSIADQEGENLGPKHVLIVLGVLSKWLLATANS